MSRWRIRAGRGRDRTAPSDYGPAYWDDALAAVTSRDHHLDAFLGELKRRAYLDLIARWGGVPRGRVLKTDLFEEAAGPDSFFPQVLEHSARGVGMDVSTAVVARARARHLARLASHVVCDARHLPFEPGSFAMVISPSTFDHFRNPSDLGRCLRELWRVLEPGGRLIITLDNRQNVFDPFLRLAIALGLVPFFIGRSYSVHELRDELQRAGFVVTDSGAIVHHPRLVAVAAVSLVKRLRSRSLASLLERVLRAAQRLEGTRWQYRSGCFVAACATRPVTDQQDH